MIGVPTHTRGSSEASTSDTTAQSGKEGHGTAIGCTMLAGHQLQATLDVYRGWMRTESRVYDTTRRKEKKKPRTWFASPARPTPPAGSSAH